MDRSEGEVADHRTGKGLGVEVSQFHGEGVELQLDARQHDAEDDGKQGGVHLPRGPATLDEASENGGEHRLRRLHDVGERDRSERHRDDGSEVSNEVKESNPHDALHFGEAKFRDLANPQKPDGRDPQESRRQRRRTHSPRQRRKSHFRVREVIAEVLIVDIVADIQRIPEGDVQHRLHGRA